MTTTPRPVEPAGEEKRSASTVLEQVRDHYANAARQATTTADRCCGTEGTCCATTDQLELGPFGSGLYDAASKDELPVEAVASSMGCGNPVAVADLHDGETVLDLGSGVTNVEFLQGTMEDIPLPDASVDVVISNCVINLSPDKPAVFRHAFRVLRPDGRLGVSDVVADDRLTPADRAARGDHVGCIAGSLSISEYRDELTSAGFTNVGISPTHAVADDIHAANIRAAKPE